MDESHNNDAEQKREDAKGSIEYDSIDRKFSDRQTAVFRDAYMSG